MYLYIGNVFLLSLKPLAEIFYPVDFFVLCMKADIDEEEVFPVKYFFGFFVYLLVDAKYISLEAMAGSAEWFLVV